MTLAEQYSAVVFPDRARALGRSLVAPTLGHLLLLLRLRSPFVVPGKVLPWHIAIALYVLSRPYAAAEKGVNSGFTMWLLKVATLHMRWTTSALQRISARTVIETWLDQAFQQPDTWDDSDAKDKKCTAPYLALLKVRLLKCGMSRSEALNYPVREAIWDLAALSDLEGKVEWTTDDEAEAMEELLRRSEAA